MEPDIHYYRRRACEEMSAASRAVTSAARQRRLHLVGLYLERLKALNAPIPFDERQLGMLAKMEIGLQRSAFDWAVFRRQSEHA